MVLLRKVIGDSLRARRLSQHRTLREVSTAANVSLGYLSEVERGHKEASSELLASICDALGAPLSEMLSDAAAAVTLAEQIEGLLPAPVDSSVAVPADAAKVTNFATLASETDGNFAGSSAVMTSTVTDGDVTVEVYQEGPLKTTLTARRTGPTSPGQRSAEPVFAG